MRSAFFVLIIDFAVNNQSCFPSFFFLPFLPTSELLDCSLVAIFRTVFNNMASLVINNNRALRHTSSACFQHYFVSRHLRYAQQGVTTLFMTSLLLSAALVISLGHYRGVYFQVKQVQNQLEASRAHWQAEGAIECAYAYIQRDGKVSWQNQAGKCGLEPKVAVSVSNIANTDHQQIVGESGRTVIHKAAALTNTSIPSGAIQTSAQLVLPYATNFYTSDPGNQVGVDENGVTTWECTTVRHKQGNKVAAMYAGVAMDIKGANFINGGISATLPISVNFSRDNKCAGHIVRGHVSSPKGLVAQKEVRPFFNLFGVAKSEYRQVKEKTVTGPNGVQEKLFALVEGANGCNRKVSGSNIIVHLIKNRRKTHIWVDGKCELSGDEFRAVSAASRSHEHGVTLVFHGESLIINSTAQAVTSANLHSANEFRGVIFYLDYGKASARQPMQFKAGLSRGFQLTGAMFIDAENKQATIGGAMTFIFNKDMLDFSRRQFSSIQWVEGSWRDF